MKEELPLVSVLMTAYNREKYIGEAIESVLASTYENFELIIVDDGSKDQTLEIAKRYATTHSSIKVYKNDKNLGDYPNRNKAASLASGKYLKYVDSDDYLYPWGLQLLVTMMEQYPQAGWGLFSLPANTLRPFPFCLNPREAYQYHYFGPGLFHKAPGSCIFVKKVFDLIGGFAPERMSGDYEMWHRLGINYPVVLMPDGIAWGRINIGHESELTHYEKHAIQYEYIKWTYLKNQKNPLTFSEKRMVHSKEIKKCTRYIIIQFLKLKFKNATNYLKIAVGNLNNKYN